MSPLLRILLASTLMASALPAQTAESERLRLPSILSDHMVIQQEKPVRVWGWSRPGERIEIRLGEQSSHAEADGNGRWEAELPALAATDATLEMTVKDSTDTLKVSDILVGEVWMCSGQSNMAFNMGQTLDAKAAVAQADRPRMRYFKVHSVSFPEPQDDAPGQWVLCSPKTAAGFSAVGYYFGRDLQEARGVPVGLIDTSQGSSTAQVFVSYDALRNDATLKGAYLKGYSDLLDDPAGAKAAHVEWLENGGSKYYEDRKQWYIDAFKAKENKEPFDRPRPVPHAPEPRFFNDTTYFPTVIYNARIHPLHPFVIRGALWYQGESNSNDPLYDKLLSGLIQDWREGWKEGDFPFLIVQLPNQSTQQESPEIENLGRTRIRELQMKVHQSVPNTGLVCSIDVGSTNAPSANANLHPSEKENIGKRLALAARHHAYGEDLLYSSPVIQSAKVEGNRIRVNFDHVGEGLKIGTPPKSSLTPQPPTDALRGFAIAGSDRKFVAAQARIEGADEVVVWSDAVSEPAYVRYAWQFSPVVNLYNSGDLPAFPFRTDED